MKRVVEFRVRCAVEVPDDWSEELVRRHFAERCSEDFCEALGRIAEESDTCDACCHSELILLDRDYPVSEAMDLPDV